MSPVLKAITSLDPSLAYILPAVHALTGCDTTSKITTKASAFRVAKEEHLKQYLKYVVMKELDHDLCLKVEHFLVKCLSRDKSLKKLLMINATQCTTKRHSS